MLIKIKEKKGSFSSRRAGRCYLYNAWDTQCIQRKQMVTDCAIPASFTAKHYRITPFSYLLGRAFLTGAHTLCLTQNCGQVH